MWNEHNNICPTYFRRRLSKWDDICESGLKCYRKTAIVTTVFPWEHTGMWGGANEQGTAGVPRKGCFLEDQGGVLSFILSYGFILVGLEAFKNPPFKRNSHSWGKGSHLRTITMSFVMSGWLIPEQGWADCPLGPGMGKGPELGCMVRWHDAARKLMFSCYCHNVGISRHFLQLR